MCEKYQVDVSSAESFAHLPNLSGEQAVARVDEHRLFRHGVVNLSLDGLAAVSLLDLVVRQPKVPRLAGAKERLELRSAPRRT